MPLGRDGSPLLPTMTLRSNTEVVRQNVDADSLSRIPWDAEQVQAVLKGGCATSCELLHLVGMKSVRPEILPKLSQK